MHLHLFVAQVLEQLEALAYTVGVVVVGRACLLLEAFPAVRQGGVVGEMCQESLGREAADRFVVEVSVPEP